MLSRTQRKNRARTLRHGDNPAEAVMWNCLKGRQLLGVKFVRQFAIGPYFADFCARSRFLVLEIDGSQHAMSDSDVTRDAFLNRMGYAVLRFWSVDVLRNSGATCDAIVAVLNERIQEAVNTPDMRYLPALQQNRLRTIKS
jgi:very-short-patch-repair endonuclease